MASELYEQIWQVVRRIPRGKVATYGQVAELAGRPGAARQVGYAMDALEDGSTVPWHRVVNAKGQISARYDRGSEREQRKCLEAEGVQFTDSGAIRLDQYQWRPRRGT